jgi:3',5'-cyclic AMP phosphodiesterase CpdA
MKNLLHTLLIFVVLQANAWAQAPIVVLESNLNDDLPGADYKFSFVHLTDIHVGEGIDDYGSPGFDNDTMPEGDVGYAAERLRLAVNYINENAVDKNLRFVIVTGDLTDSAERSEYDKAKEILNALNIPYIPQIGNHDVRGYTAFGRDASFRGDSLNNAVFEDVFEKLKVFFDKWDDGNRLKKVYSPYSFEEVTLQNFMFEYQGFGFFFADLTPRFVSRPESDLGPKPRLNNFPDGSYDWLMNAIKDYDNKGVHNMFLLTHQPPHKDPISLFNGFTLEEYQLVTNALFPYRQHLAFWLAGHVHRNRDYNVTTVPGSQLVIKARETAANKELPGGALRLIHVYEAPRITSVFDAILEKGLTVLPNPNSGSFQVKLPESSEPYAIQIIDVAGKIVREILNIPGGSIVANVSMEDQPSGQYILKAQTGNKMAAKLFIKVL